MSRCKVTNCLISLHLLAHLLFPPPPPPPSLRPPPFAADTLPPLIRPSRSLYFFFIYTGALPSSRYPHPTYLVRFSPLSLSLSLVPSILFTLFFITFVRCCCWSLTPWPALASKAREDTTTTVFLRTTSRSNATFRISLFQPPLSQRLASFRPLSRSRPRVGNKYTRVLSREEATYT